MSEPQRPRAVVEAEHGAVLVALAACQEMARVALRQRHCLLESGFPPAHALCETLDHTALRYSSEMKHQQRALARLLAELEPEPAT